VRARADDLLAEAALALGAPDQAAWHADRADACRTEHDVAVPPAFAARWAGLRARLSAAAAS
jgi:hypothetical protein